MQSPFPPMTAKCNGVLRSSERRERVREREQGNGEVVVEGGGGRLLGI